MGQFREDCLDGSSLSYTNMYSTIMLPFINRLSHCPCKLLMKIPMKIKVQQLITYSNSWSNHNSKITSNHFVIVLSNIQNRAGS